MTVVCEEKDEGGEREFDKVTEEHILQKRLQQRIKKQDNQPFYGKVVLFDDGRNSI